MMPVLPRLRAPFSLIGATIVVTAFLLVLLVLRPPPDAQGTGASPSLLISEVYAPPATGEEHGPPWLEIHNPTVYTYPLRGLVVASSRSRVPLATDAAVGPGGFVLLAPSALPGSYAAPAQGVTLVEIPELGSLDPASDALLLLSPGGLVIDQVNWGTPLRRWPNYNERMWSPGLPDFAQPAGEPRRSWGRTPPGRDTNRPGSPRGDWAMQGSPSPGFDMAEVARPDRGWDRRLWLLAGVGLGLALLATGAAARQVQRSTRQRTLWGLWLASAAGPLALAAASVALPDAAGSSAASMLYWAAGLIAAASGLCALLAAQQLRAARGAPSGGAGARLGRFFGGAEETVTPAAAAGSPAAAPPAAQGATAPRRAHTALAGRVAGAAATASTRAGQASSAVTRARDYVAADANVQVVLLYVLAIGAAELLGLLLGAPVGTLLHALLLPFLLLQFVVHGTALYRTLLPVLALLPLLRILSLTMAVPQLPQIYWYALVGGPLLLGAALAGRLLGFTRADAGLNLSGRLTQLEVAVTGVPLGLAAYLFAGPQTPIAGPSLLNMLGAALVLLVFAAFAEELIFRGLLQRAASGLFGADSWILSSALFALMYMGSGSLAYWLLIVLVGLFFGRSAQRSGSIWGVVAARAVMLIGSTLVWPSVF